MFGVALCLAAVVAPGDLHADQQAIDAGRFWLLQTVGEDGSWRSARDPSGVRSTARAIQAVGVTAPMASLPWLLAQTPGSLEETWDVASALRADLPASFLAPVDRQRAELGRWSSSADVWPAAYHTALGLLTQAFGNGVPDADRAPGAAFLASLQRLDGSWPTGVKGQETAAVTAAASVALALTDPAAAAQSIAAGRAWLLAHQNLDGGWGVGGSTVAATADALWALRWIGCPPEAETAAVAYLTGAQRWDGSWEGDPWTTALAVSALLPAGLPDLAFAVGSPTGAGDVVPGDRWEPAADVVNLGTFQASPVTLRLSVSNGAAQEVFAQELTLAPLASGQSAHAAFTVDTTLFAGTYSWSVILDPSALVAEGSEENNVATGSLTVGGSRNLVVLPESLGVFTWDGLTQLVPTNLSVGTTVQVRARVRCDGSGVTRPVSLYLFRGAPAEGFLAGEAQLAGIAAGETRDVFVPWTVSQPTGPASLTVFVDYNRQVAQTDRSDDRADLAVTVTAPDSEAPAPPSNVTAQIQSKDRVLVQWQTSSSPDVIGYRVFRDGIPINSPDLAPDSVATASDSFNLRDYLPVEWRERAAFDPPNLNDGDAETAWWSIQFPTEEGEPEPAFVQFALPGTRSVRGVIVDWYNFDFGAKKFRVQYWDGGAWADGAVVVDNILDRSVVILPAPVITDKVRILLEAGIRPDFIAIREVGILEAGPGRVVAGTSFADTAVPGLPATYTVAAVDAAGNESPPSGPFQLEDVTPPVVLLTAPAPDAHVGPEVFIRGTVTDDFLQGYAVDWGYGRAPTAWVRAGQRAEPVTDGAILTWHPPDGLDGEFTIRVSAFDVGGVGNAREARVTVFVDTADPARPDGLVSNLSGTDFELTWNPGAEPGLTYRVAVNNDRGLTDVTSQGTASASASYSNDFVSYQPGNAVDGDPGTPWRPPDDSYPSWWSLEYPAPTPLRRVQLTWMKHFVPRRFRVETRDLQGGWNERWATDDNVAKENSITFETATTVTAVRVTILEARILGAWGVNNPYNITPPPAPYPVLMEVKTLAEDLLTEPRFVTVLDESLEYSVTVQAVDALGNVSAPSTPVIVDMRGPRVKIVSPKSGDALGRAVAIRGWVEDRYLKDWVLEVGSIEAMGGTPVYWEKLRQSLSTVSYGGMLSVWYPTFRKGWQALRLTARDQAGFTSQTRVDFQIDAMPPESPSDLAATEAGDQVTLTWSPSLLEADGSGPCQGLRGYRVYKNEIPLTAKDVSFLAMVSAPTVDWELQGLPSLMVDGLPGSTWSPVPFATSAEILLDLPQPYDLGQVVIRWADRDWEWGRDYTVDLLDKATGTWVQVADVADSLFPVSEHSFPTVVTDRARITLKRGWTTFSLGAIAEIGLVRSGNSDLLAAPEYVEAIPGEGEAAYRVTAVDEHGNESAKTNRVRLDHSPPKVALTAPAAGDLRVPAGTVVRILGTIEDPLLREYQVEVGAGDVTGEMGGPPTVWTTIKVVSGDLTSVLTPALLATWRVPADVEGPYTFRLSALDEGVRRAETHVVVRVDTRPPPSPAGLLASREGGNVRLNWQAVVDAGLAGYHVYRNGKRLDIAQVAGNAEAKASSNVSIQKFAIDGDPGTYWQNMWLQIPAWMRLSFDGFYPVESIAIDWHPWAVARDFKLQTWDRALQPEPGWVDLEIVQDFDANPYVLTLAQPVRIEGLKVLMTRAVEVAQVNDGTWFGIREIGVFRAPGAETPTLPTFLDDAVGDLEYTFRVTAVDDFGNESLPSAEAQLDEVPPRVVVTAPPSGQRVGAHVEIAGTIADRRLVDYRVEVAEGASGGSWTEVVTREAPVEDNVLAVWDAPAGKDGDWRFRITARDLAGQQTVVERTVHLDSTPPPTPHDLTAAEQGTDAVRLDWAAGAAPDFATFRVYRNERLLNDPLVSPWGAATGSGNAVRAGEAIDGRLDTSWQAWAAPYSWEESFPSEVAISAVDIHWVLNPHAFISPPRDYEFQALIDGGWRTVLMVWENAFAHRVHTIPTPEAALGFRILITGPDRMDGGTEWGTAIAEVRLYDGSRAAPLVAPSYLDAGLCEIGWNYRVSAVDDLGNESPSSGIVTVDSRAPVVNLLPPAEAVIIAPIDLRGTVRDTNLHSWRLKVGAGASPAYWEEIAYGTAPIEGGVLARWVPPDDYRGTFTFKLSAEDRAGNAAFATLAVEVGTLPPEAPTSLAGAVREDGSVLLTWGPPSQGGAVGYNVYRNGQRLNRRNLAPLGVASASSEFFPAAYAIDGSEETPWVPYAFLKPAWLAVDFPQVHRVSGVNLSWYRALTGEHYEAANYQIQVREDGDWKTVVFVENDENESRADYFEDAVSTDGVRILLTQGIDDNFVGVVRELQILAADTTDLLTGTNYVDSGLSLVEGVYAVTSVDEYGHEGLAQTIVIDQAAPRVAVAYPRQGDRIPGRFTLIGSVADATLSEIAISWSRNDGVWESLGRFPSVASDQQIGTVAIPYSTSYEGPGTIRLEVSDRAGHLTQTLIPVTVDTVAPDAPAAVFAVPQGNAGADLSWSPSLAPDVQGYFVLRNGQQLNPGNLVEAGVASASEVYENSDYHQASAAVDTVYATAWWSALTEGPKHLEIAFPAAVEVSELEIVFAGNPFLRELDNPHEFHVDVLTESGWQTVVEDDQPAGELSRYYSTTFPPRVTTRIRFVATSGWTQPNFMIGVREIVVRGPGMVLGTSYADSALAAAESAYTVVAQDVVGNRSAPSSPAYVDALPPRVSLSAPANDALTNASTRISGQVQDANLSSWILSWGRGAAPTDWATLRQGAKTPFGEHLWNTAGIDEDVTVKLLAVDGKGQESSVARTFHADGVPPGATTGLLADARADGVHLAWNASPETDLAGYLVVRDGKVLTAASIAPLGRAWASSELVDANGIHYPAQSAIDGNPGTTWSNQLAMPGLVMWGVDFDEPFSIRGVNVNLATLSYFGCLPLPDAIYVEGLVDGVWNVLATATENTVEVRTFAFDPVSVTGLRLRFPSTLGWPVAAAVREVEIVPSGATGPVASTDYLDANVADPFITEHRWQVAAVDLAGNVGPAGPAAVVDGSAPSVAVESPTEDATVGPSVAVRGTVDDNLLSSWTLTAALGGDAPTEIAHGSAPVAGAALGIWEPPSGRDADGVLTLTATDAAGRSASAVRNVHVDTVSPGSPSTPMVSKVGPEITVCWDPPQDADVAGYIVQRNGEPLQAADLAPHGLEVSEGVQVPAWQANEPRLMGAPGAWYGRAFDTPHAFASLRVSWWGSSWRPMAPTDFSIQVRRGGEWETVHRFAGETRFEAEYVFDGPAVGDAIRIKDEGPSDYWHFTSFVVVAEETAPVTGTCYRDWSIEGWSAQEASYSVVALDHVGNRSAASGERVFDAFSPRLALDRPAPGALVPAIAPVSGFVRDTLLTSWSVEASLGGGAWQPGLSGTTPVEGSFGNWRPPAGYEGPGRLRLTAVDLAGNSASTEVALVIDADVPGAPTGLAATRDGLVSNLSWVPPPADDLAGYRVYRNAIPVSGDITSLARFSTLLGTPLERDESGRFTALVYGPPFGVEMQFDYRPDVGVVAVHLTPNDLHWVPADLSLESWDGSQWVAVASLLGNTRYDVLFTPAAPLAAERLRIVFHGWVPGAAMGVDAVAVTAAGPALVAGTSYTLKSLAQSQDAYTVAAVDLAGNEGPSSARAFVDNILPLAEVTTPAPGALVADGASIVGSADDRFLDRWTLRWRKGPEPAAWVLLAEGTEPKAGAALAQLAIEPGEEGEATLRLEVSDLSGLASADELAFGYDNKPPVAELALADRYWTPGALARIAGTATDAHLSSASVSFAQPLSGQQGTLGTWADSRSGELAMVETTAMPSDEVCELTLRVEDGVGLVSQASQRVNVAWVRYEREWSPRLPDGTAIAPASAAVAGDSTWVVDNQRRLLHRLGPDGVAVQSTPLPPGAGGVVAAPARLWLYGGAGFQPCSFEGYPEASATAAAVVGFALRPDGSPAVLESDKVSFFTTAGVPSGSFALAEAGRSLAIDARGYLYVRTASDAVHVYDPQGRLFTEFAKPDNAPATGGRIAVDPSGRVALANLQGWAWFAEPAIRALGANGEGHSRFGIVGNAPQEIWAVSDIAFSDGRILIVDEVNRKVLEFTLQFPEGPFETPTARLLSPAAGARVRQGAMVTGSAWNGPDTAWTLEAGQGTVPAAWSLVDQGTGPVQQGLLGRWDTRSLADGAWTLRLTVSGSAGPAAEDHTTVLIDNAAPVAVISAPEEGHIVSGAVSVIGTASDLGFSYYTLSVQRSGDAAETVLAQGSAPVENGVLGAWDAANLPAGVYTLTLTVTDFSGNTSRHQVSVSIGGVAYLATLGQGLLSNPVAVARFPDGRWAVADSGKVVILAADGSFAGEITANDHQETFGSLLVAYDRMDLAVLPDGRLAVLAGCRVSLFDAQGAALSSFGECGSEEDRVKRPGAIAADAGGRVHVTSWPHLSTEYPDVGYKTFAQDGAYLGQVLGWGADPGQFRKPAGIGVDQSGTVAVLDDTLKRVQLFDGDGRLLRVLPLSLQSYDPPTSLAADPSGALLVLIPSSLGGNQLQLLTPQGRLAASWAKYGADAGLLQTPTDVWLGSGLAAVTDAGKQALVVYDVSALATTPPEPVARLVEPQSGAPVAAHLRVLGTAAGPGVTGFRLLVGEGAEPATFVQVASGAGAVVDGALGALDLSALPEGAVTIRLEVVGAAGLLTATQASCILDKTPPVVEILSPEPYALLREGERIGYRVAGADASFSLLMVRDDQVAGARKVLAAGTGNAEGEASWNAADFPPGPYRVTLVAQDAAGNFAIVRRMTSTGQIRYAGSLDIPQSACPTPSALAADGDQLLVVCNDTVIAVNRQGAVIGPILPGVSLAGVKQVLALPDRYVGLFAVGSGYTMHLRVYRRDGTLEAEVTTAGGVPDYFDRYSRLEGVDSRGRILVLHGSLRAFALDLSYLGEVAGAPASVAVRMDGSGNLYYAGTASAIHITTPQDEAASSFGEHGPEPWRFGQLRSLAVDRSGHVMVQDEHVDGSYGGYGDKTCFSFWTPDGRYLGHSSGRAYSEGWIGSSFWTAADPEWGADGLIYVLSNAKILVFDPAALLRPEPAPIAAVAAPAEGDYVPSVFPVAGTALGPGTYTLRLESAAYSQDIASGAANLQDGLLGVARCQDAPDGVYQVVLRVETAQGSIESRRSVTLNTVAPVVAIDSPRDLSRVEGPTRVIARVQSPSLSTWYLDVSYTSFFYNYWMRLAEGTTPIDGEIHLFDPTTLAPGSHTLRLTAFDLAGHQATASAVVSVGSAVALERLVQIAPDSPGWDPVLNKLVFLPDGTFVIADGEGRLRRRDAAGAYLGELLWSLPEGWTSPLTFHSIVKAPGGFALIVSDSASYYAAVADASGALQHWVPLPASVFSEGFRDPIVTQDRVLVLKQSSVEVFAFDGSRVSTWGEAGTDPGEFSGLGFGLLDDFGRVLLWDGPVSAFHAYSLDGTYRGRMDIRDEGGYPVQPAYAAAVDSRGNLFVSGHRFNYLYRADGTYLETYSSTWVDQPGSIFAPAGVAFDDAGKLWALDKPFSDTFRLQTFGIDRERLRGDLAPLALYGPGEGGALPAEGWVQGCVTGVAPLTWSLKVGVGSSPSEWEEIAQGQGAVPLGILGRWTAGERADGVYSLKLEAREGNGAVSEVRRVFELDTTPPTVAIDQPVEHGVLVGSSASVTGQIADARPASYGIKYYGADQAWWTISGGTTYPAGTTLAPWSLEYLTTNVYRLKAWAVDAAANLSVATRDVSREPVRFLGDEELPGTYPPAAPPLVAASRHGEFAVVSPDRATIQIRRQGQASVTVAVAPDPGQARFWVEGITFSPEGELVVYGWSEFWRFSWYSAGGDLLATYTFSEGGPEPSGTRFTMKALSSRRMAAWAQNDFTGEMHLDIFSSVSGLVGSFSTDEFWNYYPNTMFAVDPEENFVLPLRGADGMLQQCRTYTQGGTLVRTTVLSGWSGWYTSIDVDGAGAFYVQDDLGVTAKYAPDGTLLWSMGAFGPYPGRYIGLAGPAYGFSVVAGGGGEFSIVEPHQNRVHHFQALDGLVDTTAPLLALDPALAGAPLHGIAQIVGTVSDAHLRAWTLWALPGGDPAGAVVVAAGALTSVENAALGAWDTTWLDGNWLLVLEAEDAAGNASRLELAVSMSNDLMAPVVRVQPAAGLYRAAQTATLVANKPATIHFTTDGTPPTTASPVYTGPIAVGYTLTLRWLALDAAEQSVEGAAEYVIDTVPPVVSIDPPPNPLRTTALTLTGTVEPGAVLTVALSGTGTVGELVRPTAGTWSCAVSDLAGGEQVTFTATARDAAGNTSSAATAVTANLNQPPVLDPIGAQFGEENGQLFFFVTASDPENDALEISVSNLPAGAVFGGFYVDWTPTPHQSGTYVVTFHVSDGDLEDSEEVTITVADVNRAPTVPVVSAPRTQTEVTTLQPELVLEDSVDPDEDVLTYEYEIYADQALTVLVASQASVGEGQAFTGWTAPAALDDNTWYWWRARAFDGQAHSQWTEQASVFVNTANDPPGAFETVSPVDGSEVPTQWPALWVMEATDPDGDYLTYDFQVYSDAGLTALVYSSGPVYWGAGFGTAYWYSYYQSLQEDTWYWWRVIATDEHGASTSTATASFYVNTWGEGPTTPEIPSEGGGSALWPVSLMQDPEHYWRVLVGGGLASGESAATTSSAEAVNDAPAAPTVRNPGADAWLDSRQPRLEVNAAADPNGDPLTYEFEVYAQSAPATPVAAGASPTPDWTVTSLLADSTWYTWRARAIDQYNLPGPWTADSAFYVNNNGIDDPPSITVTMPAAGYDYIATGNAFTIRWADEDSDSNAAISLFYDTNDSGSDGTPIVAGLQEDLEGAGDSYTWDLTSVPAGTYWVYGTIADATSTRSSYSLGTVTVDKQPPQTTVSPAAGSYTSPVTVTLTAIDTVDANPVIRYTLDGSTPTLQSAVYSGPLTFTTTTTLKFFATDAVGCQEAVQGPYVYTIAPTNFTITANAGANGTISPAGAVSVPANGSRTFTITPEANYTISDVTVDGASVGAVSTYTFSSVTAEHTISATFAGYTAVTAVAPNGGETIASGSTWEIRWGAPATAAKFDLSYSTNNGASYTSIATGRTGTSYAWTVPKLTANSTTCLVKVVGKTSAGDTVGTDTSDAVFAIEVVRVTAPNGGETFHRPSTPTVPITWVTNGTSQTVNKVTLSYSTNGGSTWTKITDLASNPGSYTWTLPATYTSQYRVKVELFRSNTALGSDTSDANFTIANP